MKMYEEHIRMHPFVDEHRINSLIALGLNRNTSGFFWLRIYKVMGKVRLQDLAKKLGVRVKDVQEVLKEWGIEKSNFAYLEEEEIQIVLDHFGKEITQEIKEEKKEEKVESVQGKELTKKEKPPQKLKEEERKKETLKREKPKKKKSRF
jgi:hypothetical protein